MAESKIQNPKSKIRNGFTLVEVLISVALVVMLLIGVNQVFRMTSETIAGGTTLSRQTRDLRAAQAAITRDVGAMAVDGPLLVISCRTHQAFLNAADRQADLGGDPATIDANGDGIEGNDPGETFTFTEVNYRIHRYDVLAFCARDMFRRQMGSKGQFVGPGTSAEAYIHYGPARLPSNTNGDAYRTYFNFGENVDLDTGDTNVNNIYASQVMYTRMALLLMDPSQIAAGEPYVKKWQNGDVSGNPPSGTSIAPGNWAALLNEEKALSPLSMRSLLSTSVVDNPTFLRDSRCDVAGTTLNTLRGDIAAAKAASSNWWMPLLYEPYNYIASKSLSYGTNRIARFHCNPWFSKPLNSTSMAEASTQFLPNVNQFIVEYAGDYLTQAPDGTVTALGPDGQVDFCIDRTKNPDGVKRIRWYGRPRDVNGDGVILGGGYMDNMANWADPNVRAQRLRDMVDVVPLLDYRNCFSGATAQFASFEKEAPEAGDPITAAGPTINVYKSPDHYNAQKLDTYNNPYTCVFTTPAEMPWMIRVIVQVCDPTDRLRNGQWAEMVFNLK